MFNPQSADQRSLDLLEAISKATGVKSDTEIIESALMEAGERLGVIEVNDENEEGVSFSVKGIPRAKERQPASNPRMCPSCNSTDIRILRRITGYLSTEDKFNDGKHSELHDREPHSTSIKEPTPA